MKKLLLCALLAGWLSAAFSQSTISGTVINEETSEPVAAASIQIKGTYSGTATEDGDSFPSDAGLGCAVTWKDAESAAIPCRLSVVTGI